MNFQLLELIFLSEKRKDLLLLLREGPKTIAEIKLHLNVGAVAILPQLKKLKEDCLVVKKGDLYSLSPIGIAVAGRMQPMIDLLKLFGTQYDYWANHKIECLPAPFMKRIGDLSKCTFSEPPDKTRLFEPHREFTENLAKSKKISGIASIFHPSYPSFFFNFTKMGMDVSIVVTPQIYKRIKEEFEDVLRESFKYKNGIFFVCRKEIEFSYVVTDRFLSLSLPFSDGTYDHQRDILCFDPVALQWGEDLFAYYKSMSYKITEI